MSWSMFYKLGITSYICKIYLPPDLESYQCLCDPRAMFLSFYKFWTNRRNQLDFSLLKGKQNYSGCHGDLLLQTMMIHFTFTPFRSLLHVRKVANKWAAQMVTNKNTNNVKDGWKLFTWLRNLPNIHTYSTCVRCWIMLMVVTVCQFANLVLKQTMTRLHHHDSVLLLLFVWFYVLCLSLCSLLSRFISSILLLHSCTTCLAYRGCCCPLPSHWSGVTDPSPPAASTCLLPRCSSAIHELHSLLPQVNSDS